jgi:hypothetical protein
MSINNVNTNPQRLIANAQHIGKQTEVLKKKDVKTSECSKDEATHPDMDDSVSLSDYHKKEAETESPQNKAKKAEQESQTSMKETGDIETQEGTESRADTGTIQGRAETPADKSLHGEQSMYIMGGPGSPPPGSPHLPSPNEQPSASFADTAAKTKESQEDMQKAQTIYAEMAASRQKWLMQMWQIVQDTQTAIMQMLQESALRKAKMMDTCAAKWAACLGGYDLK